MFEFRFLRSVAVFAAVLAGGAAQADIPSLDALDRQWPKTDLADGKFMRDALMVHGERNVIPPLNEPQFLPLPLARHVAGLEPVITVSIDGVERAYPMRIVAAHGIVNDDVNGTPIAVTYCRVCAASMVFIREVGGARTRLGMAGVSLDNNLVLFDEATETWWQQINGFGLAGAHKDAVLEVVPSKIESFARFKTRMSDRRDAVVLRDSARSRTPLASRLAIDLPGEEGLPPGVSPIDRVIIVDERAFSLELLRQERRVEEDDLVILWEPGRLAGPDAFGREAGRDVGNVDVFRRGEDGVLRDEAYRLNLGHALRDLVKTGEVHVLPPEIERALPDALQ